MPESRQTVVYWANIEISRGFDFTFAPGTQPSVCNIYTVPHVEELPNVGTLTFYTKDENGDPIETFEFPDCLLESPRLSVNADGQFWTLPVFDRRWKWRYGWIDGSYNVPQANGIAFTREKNPQELASLLLDAMGEVGYDVSRLPDATDVNARPHVEWDSANPAAELDALCQQFDSVVVLNHITNQVEIWPVRSWLREPDPPLPSDVSYSGLGFALVYPSQPQTVIMEAAATLFDGTFRTEAVGRDTDGSWKPIDELSYVPSGGWGTTYPPAGFKGYVTGTYSDGGQTLETSDLAESCIFRCYRLVGLIGGGTTGDVRPWAPELLTNDPDLEPEKFRDLRIFDTLSTTEIGASEIEEESGGLVAVPARAYTRRDPIIEDLKQNTDPVDWTYGFSLDSQHGIATFPQAIMLFDYALSTGTAQSGSTSTTIKLATSAPTTDDVLNGAVIEIIGGTGNGQTKTITDYVGSTRVATVSTWSITPDDTTKYQVWYPQTGSAAPAIVRIRCGFYAGKDGIFHRHSLSADTGSTVDTPPRLDKHKEIQRVILYPYDNTTDALSGSPEDNHTDCDARLQYWLDAALAEYGQQQGGTATYESLVALSPDGLIQQITWSASTSQGPRTVASAAQRHNRYVPSLDNQRHGVLVPKISNTLDDINKAMRSAGDVERLVIT